MATVHEFKEWKPGILGRDVALSNPAGGISKDFLMMMITWAQKHDKDSRPIELIESAISVTDDAILHMMRKR